MNRTDLIDVLDRYDDGLLVRSPPPHLTQYQRGLDRWIKSFNRTFRPTRMIPIGGQRKVYEFSLYDVSEARMQMSRQHVDEIHEHGYGNPEKDDIAGPYVGMDTSGCLIDSSGDEPRVTGFTISLKESSNPPVGSIFSGIPLSSMQRLARLERVVKRCNAPREVTLLQQHCGVLYPDMNGKAYVLNFDTDVSCDLFFEFVCDLWEEYQREFEILGEH